MICNKKPLKEQCKNCEHFKECIVNNKFVKVNYFEPLQKRLESDMVNPFVRKQELRDIKIDKDTTITIDLIEIQEQLNNRFNPLQNLL